MVVSAIMCLWVAVRATEFGPALTVKAQKAQLRAASRVLAPHLLFLWRLFSAQTSHNGNVGGSERGKKRRFVQKFWSAHYLCKCAPLFVRYEVRIQFLRT